MKRGVIQGPAGISLVRHGPARSGRRRTMVDRERDHADGHGAAEGKVKRGKSRELLEYLQHVGTARDRGWDVLAASQ